MMINKLVVGHTFSPLPSHWEGRRECDGEGCSVNSEALAARSSRHLSAGGLFSQIRSCTVR